MLDAVGLAADAPRGTVLGEEDRLEVVAGTKAAALAGDHQAAHRVIGADVVDRLEDLRGHLGADGVHHLGPGEGQCGDTVVGHLIGDIAHAPVVALADLTLILPGSLTHASPPYRVRR